jgi:hypothetical protein
MLKDRRFRMLAPGCAFKDLTASRQKIRRDDKLNQPVNLTAAGAASGGWCRRMRVVLDFFQSVYDAAADLAHWHRIALDRPRGEWP